ncbi:MAG: hypothetical protein ACI9GH_000493 [Candidatus Paceibacteria bacterium]|jgi:hypothetical protein
MNEQTTSVEVVQKFGRVSFFRPFWWILQSIIINVWQFLLLFVLIWQLLHILVIGEKHEWSRDFTRKYVNHLKLWTEYTFWVTDEQPEIIEYK